MSVTSLCMCAVCVYLLGEERAFITFSKFSKESMASKGLRIAHLKALLDDTAMGFQ